jgi:peptide/nickel transport system permease protein
MLCISVFAFALVRITGDPVALILGPNATPEMIAAYRAENGLDAPLFIQYLRYIGDALTGDFGQSIRYREPVGRLLWDRLPATLELGIAAVVLSLVVGIPVGVFSALRRSGFLDGLVRILVLLGQAIPGFYLGILMILLFAVRLGWFPTGGRGGLRYLVLPTIALGTNLVALIVRVARSSMLDVLHQDYVRTAHAKGLAYRAVVLRHALKNAMIPLVTVVGLQAGVIFSGAIVTETVFSWPGVGRLIVASIFARDFPVVQTTVLFVTGMVILSNLVVDIIYTFLDPRIKYG